MIEILYSLAALLISVVLVIFAFKLGWRLLKLFIGIMILAITVSLIVFLWQTGCMMWLI